MNRRLTALTLATIVVCGYGSIPATEAAPSAAVSPQVPRTTETGTTEPTGDVLAVGSRGGAVTDLQERFARWGYTITVDGWFGPQTEGVVRSWQRSNGIEVDGLVGPETRATFNVADALAGTAGAAAGADAERGTPVADPPQSVPDMIREVWPDDLEECALVIAYRESRYVPTADNGICCHGIFQIYWSVHRGWLAGFGVTSVEQLYDPMTNVRMAFELYKRAGWGPWSQTDPGA